MLATTCTTDFLWDRLFVRFHAGTKVPRMSVNDCLASDAQRPGSHLLYDQSDVSFSLFEQGRFDRGIPPRGKVWIRRSIMCR